MGRRKYNLPSILRQKITAFLTSLQNIHNKKLPEIAKAFGEVGDNKLFKQLLIPCASYLDAAYRIVGFWHGCIWSRRQ